MRDTPRRRTLRQVHASPLARAEAARIVPADPFETDRAACLVTRQQRLQR